MAKHQIDELSLNIDIDVKKDIDKTISSLASAITQLNKAVGDVGALERYAKTLGKITSKSVKIPSATAVGKAVSQKETPNLLKTANVPDTNVGETAQEMREVAQATQNAVEKAKDLNEQLDISSKLKVGFKIPSDVGTKISETTSETKKYGEVVKAVYKQATDNGFRVITTQDEIVKSIKDVRVEQKKMGETTQDTGKKAKKSAGFFGKFVKSIGRIALYRAIRTVLSTIVNSAKEGFNNFVKFDEASNKSMSNISNSIGQLKNTLGVSFGNILQSLEPIIVTLSDRLTGLLDNFNMVMASISGKSTYKKAIKQNKDYAESLGEINDQLLSFDKFESLQKQTESISSENLFKEELISDEYKASLDHIFFVLGEIGALLVAFASYKIITWIQGGGIKKLTEGLSAVKGKIDNISTAGLIASSAFVFVSSIVNLIDVIKNWDSQSLITKISAITSVVLGLASVIFAILAAIPAIGHATVFKAVSIGLAAGSALSVGASAMRFADGGMVPSEKGTTFIAGEAGAEVVHTSARGTGVTNIEQFSQAMLQALATYGVARGSDVSFQGDVYINQTKAGQLLEGSVFREGVRVGHFKRV